MANASFPVDGIHPSHRLGGAVKGGGYYLQAKKATRAAEYTDTRVMVGNYEWK